MVGGAWPFLVGGAIGLVNSDNERDYPAKKWCGLHIRASASEARADSQEVGIMGVSGVYFRRAGASKPSRVAGLRCLHPALGSRASHQFLIRGIDGFKPHERD